MVYTEERYLLKYSNTKYYKRNSQGDIQGTTNNVEIAGEWTFYELQEKGYSQKDIAKLLNVSRQTIFNKMH